jgi:hypothetical protein
MNLFNSGIIPSVNSWLLEKSKEERNYGEYWSASSAGYCYRRLIFERLGVPHVEKDGDARKQRVFTAGAQFHEWLQSITREAKLSVAQENEIQDEDLMVRGHFDDLVYVEGKLILYDYKSQNSRAFSYKKPEMSYFHHMQLGTYLYILRKLKTINGLKGRVDTHDLTESRILKISKDDLRLAEEELLWSPELAEEVIDYWKELNRLWKARKVPPCTCGDREGGFLAKEAYNPYWFNGEPCSLALLEKWKAE